METTEMKYATLVKALDSLKESLEFFTKIQEHQYKNIFEQDYGIAYRATRDSIVRRFEFSIELLWKYIRTYLENIKQVTIESNTPRDVIRTACESRLLTEKEAEYFITMIKSRNLTSHIYKEELAEKFAHDIPKYYKYMNLIAQNLNPQ